MMKRLLSFCLLLLAISTMKAQFVGDANPILTLTSKDTVPNNKLLITECMIPNWSKWGYYELTNLSDETIDLANFFIQTRYPWRADPFAGNDSKKNLKGKLKPGEQHLIITAQLNSSIDGYGNLVWKDGLFANEEMKMMADTITTSPSVLGGSQIALYSRYINPQDSTVDSMIVDIFNVESNDHGGNLAIAGVNEGNMPAVQRVWVRKTTVKKGISVLGRDDSMLAWDAMRGTDIVDSEWLPLPYQPLYGQFGSVFTTVKKHGKANGFDVKSKIQGLSIDEAALKITVPYQTRRDSFIKNFEVGDNIGWNLILGQDSAKYFLQTGDEILFYLCGDSLQVKKFQVNVTPAPENFVEISPKVYKINKNNYIRKYDVSQGYLPYDTIGNIPYAERFDTIFKYLVFEEGMTNNIIHKNGKYSPDVTDGDMVTVTAKDGVTSKTYIFGVHSYFPSHQAELKTVIFPGLELWENPKTFFSTDTFLDFSASAFKYNVLLPEGTEVTPSIIAVPKDIKARVNISKAKNLFGTESERTSTITVTADDDTTVYKYNITFKVDRPVPELDYTPFISDIGTDWSVANNYNMQIYNPSDEWLDFSNYVIAQINGGVANLDTWQNTNIKNDTTGLMLRPGYLQGKGTDGELYFKLDLNQSNFWIPPRNVFSLAHFRAFPSEGIGSNKELAEKIDYLIFKTNNVLPWKSPHLGIIPDIYGTKRRLFANFDPAAFNAGCTNAIFKITNDSVAEGTKKMNDFLNDYELVDVVNGFNNQGSPWIFYDTVNGKNVMYEQPNSHRWNIYRKPSVYKGNTTDRASFGVGVFNDSVKEVIQPSEWVVYGHPGKGLRYVQSPPDSAYLQILDISRARFENHTMNVTSHIPYLLSTKYLITQGMSENENIYGIAQNTSFADFKKNIILSDPGMKVVLTNSAGNEKQDEEIVANGDLVVSTSARGTDKITYKVQVGVLDGNNTLTSTKYTITVAQDKKTGTISNVQFGTTISDLLANVTAPELAKVLVTDGANGVVSHFSLSNDTNKVGLDARVDALAGKNVYLEVTAQDGNICLYSLEFKDESTPYVLSDIYDVNESEKLINYVGITNIKIVLSKLRTSPKFKMKIVNKIGQDRENGIIKLDDRVVVYDPENMANAVTYRLKFTQYDFATKLENNIAGPMHIAYPNPTEGKFMVFGKAISNVTVRDISGRIIKNIANSGNSVEINLASELNGIYLVTVRDSKGTSTLKVIKE